MYQTKLSNGLRVLIIPNGSDQSVTVELIGLAGSGYEGNAAGAAHFLEHLLFDGTKNYPETEKLDNIVNSKGSRKNGMTSKDYARYFVKSLPAEIESSFIYLCEIITKSLLRESDIDREKTIIEQEINRFKDDPTMYMPRKMYSLLYPKSHFGRFVTGDVNEVKALNRKQIYQFWEKHYCANNFVMVVAGKIELDNVKKLADKYFSTMPAGKQQNIINEKANKDKDILVENRDALKQSHFLIAFPAPSNDDSNRYAVEVLIKILTRGFSSRLYNILRTERAMIYSLRGIYRYSSFGGMLGFSTAVDESLLNEAIYIINTELKLISTELVSNDELTFGKNVASSDALFNKELNQDMSFSYAYDLLTTGEIIDPDTARKKYQAVTKEDVCRMAEQIFSQNPKLIVLTKKLKVDEIVY